MDYVVEDSLLWDFRAWEGGKRTLDRLKELTYISDVNYIRKVQEYIEEELSLYKIQTETEINDFLWFYTETIEKIIGRNLWG